MMKKPCFNKEVIGKARKGEELFDGSGLRILCDASFIKWRPNVDGGALCKVAGDYKNINLCTTCVNLRSWRSCRSTMEEEKPEAMILELEGVPNCY
ncbi:hypothetical protein HanHA300_Chr14g0539211 [Helianthus annuus]|nr:hypothetical protein HanHA300_Chr14g0539211 [Helianthus annuus]KAJ0487126.1 hypothetical protein HanHA89_Chr14g0586981 [Helianthus annuus]